ncbi:hypothetical protein CFOL_v3_32550 [Cephalotus follicularis]|uniref:Uncharacterized protein n=1 Tax=Cephalotus follicularis TaxID=3775 RepID=A0A1Q3D9L2_CEPFO|nr:hypothetical protein CFOL_v3_32550 [Cephalotus follicularis]
MKKTFYYNFFPIKTEEEAVIACNIPQQVTRTLIEIRDMGPSSPYTNSDINDPWKIRKLITNNVLKTGKLRLSHEEMFDHVFRYWTLDMANKVVMGSKYFVTLLDYSDDHDNTIIPKRYQTENTFFEKAISDTYVLGFLDLVHSRLLNPGDEVGLLWDTRSTTFSFKLLRRGISMSFN